MAMYLHAHLRLKYGFANLARYESAMPTLRYIFESSGMKLVIGTVTRIGPLYEAINVWQVDDYNHIERTLAGADLTDEAVAEALQTLNETIDSEQTRIIEDLTFAALPK